MGSKGGALAIALTSHQCGPNSNPGVDAICGSSLLLVLSFAPRGFSSGTPVFSNPQKPTFLNSTSTRNGRWRINFWMCYLEIAIYLLFISICKVPTFRLSGSSVLPAYPGFIVMNTAHDCLSASSTPSNMKRSACKESR